MQIKVDSWIIFYPWFKRGGMGDREEVQVKYTGEGGYGYIYHDGRDKRYKIFHIIDKS